MAFTHRYAVQHQAQTMYGTSVEYNLHLQLAGEHQSLERWSHNIVDQQSNGYIVKHMWSSALEVSAHYRLRGLPVVVIAIVKTASMQNRQNHLLLENRISQKNGMGAVIYVYICIPTYR